MKHRILVVDDEAHIREVICFALERDGMTTISAANGKIALAHTQREKIDLIVLDVGMPEMDGLELCRRVRATSDIPILFLSARDEEIDRIIGLEIGGDDYVTKPFSPRELRARVKAILKRTASRTDASSKNAISCGPVHLNRQQHSVAVSGQAVHLTGSEFDLLWLLIAQPQFVFSRTQIIEAIHGQAIHVSERTIDSHVRNIRSKFKTACNMEIITTEHGIGFKCALADQDYS